MRLVSQVRSTGSYEEWQDEDGNALGVMPVGGTTPRITATYTRAAAATGAFAAGDMIGDTTTAASSTPITFTLPRPSGRINGMRCVVTAASGTIVIAAFDFDLLLFRPNGSVPFAAGSYPGDNAAMNISAAAMRELVGIFRFTNTLWRNQAGANAAAGSAVYQSAGPSAISTRPFYPFNVDDLASETLIGVMQAQGAWNPGNVAQQFDFAMDADLD